MQTHLTQILITRRYHIRTTSLEPMVTHGTVTRTRAFCFRADPLHAPLAEMTGLAFLQLKKHPH